MTLKDAYRILRRYEDWCIGKDCRTSDDALYEPGVREAIKTILKPRGLGKPLFGNRMPKAAGTHWVVFMKTEVVPWAN